MTWGVEEGKKGQLGQRDRGYQCFILKVKVTGRRRSRGTHGEYKADQRQERILILIATEGIFC